jgi:hypothetical protein
MDPPQCSLDVETDELIVDRVESMKKKYHGRACEAAPAPAMRRMIR